MPNDTLQVGTFTPPVLLGLARSLGRLDDAHLDVVEVPVPSSPAQFEALEARRLDVVFTSPDNVLAYRFLTGNPLGRLLDVAMIAGVDRGLALSLWTREEVTTPAPLRLGVDVAASGFAFLGYELAARAGMARGSYDVVELGSTPRRLEALLDGGCDATVLNAGNELRAARAGARRIGGARDLPVYLGTVLASLGGRADEPAITRFSRVVTDLAGELIAGEHDALVLETCAQRLGLSDDEARAHLEVLRDERDGLVGDGAIHRTELETLLDLRAAASANPQLASARERLHEVVVGGLAG